MDNVKRLELTITALKQSFANKLADAEVALAEVRAEASLLIEEQAEKIANLQEQLQAKSTDVKDSESEDVAVSS